MNQEFMYLDNKYIVSDDLGRLKIITADNTSLLEEYLLEENNLENITKYLDACQKRINEIEDIIEENEESINRKKYAALITVPITLILSSPLFGTELYLYMLIGYPIGILLGGIINTIYPIKKLKKDIDLVNQELVIETSKLEELTNLLNASKEKLSTLQQNMNLREIRKNIITDLSLQTSRELHQLEKMIPPINSPSQNTSNHIEEKGKVRVRKFIKK